MNAQPLLPLQSMTLLSGLSSQTLVALDAVATLRNIPAGQHILLEGAPCEAVDFIAKGEVQIYRLSPQGRRQVLVRLGAGAAFNLVPIFESRGRAPNVANAVAIDDVTLYVILADDMRRLARRYPDLARALLTDFADRLAHLAGLAGDLSLYPVRARLARFLLEHGDAPTRWTHETIAARIGSVREVVSRTLRQFAKEGLLHTERQRIVVVDRARLEEEAQG